MSSAIYIDTEVLPLQNNMIYANRAELRLSGQFEFPKSRQTVKGT